MKITRFEDIEAWKAARTLVQRMRRLSKTPAFLQERDLARQLLRAGISAMANIAEGFDAATRLEFRRFLRIARRSLSEVQSHLYVALDFQLLHAPKFQELYDLAVSAKRLIGGFLRYLDAHPSSPHDGDIPRT
ncbi:MAG TPA: four helix bundle protein [Planctomycetota bacterium]|nr:four helix bundle protein [Planctomycetota bacterium]